MKYLLCLIHNAKLNNNLLSRFYSLLREGRHINNNFNANSLNANGNFYEKVQMRYFSIHGEITVHWGVGGIVRCSRTVRKSFPNSVACTCQILLFSMIIQGSKTEKGIKHLAYDLNSFTHFVLTTTVITFKCRYSTT